MSLDTVLLRNRDYLSYWSASLISGLGDAMFLLALNWMVVQRTHSGVILGSLTAAISLPQIVLATVGGVIVDRFDPKWVMIASDAIRAVVMAFLCLMGVHGVPPIWSLYVMGVVFGCVDAMFIPARSALQQRLVAPDRYTQSFGLLMVGFQAASIAGPVLGGVLISDGNYEMAIATNGLSFIVSMLLLLFVRRSRMYTQVPQRRDNSSYLADLRVAIRYVWKNHLILTTSFGAFVVNACVQAAMISIPFLAQQARLGAQGFGFMNMGVGIGGALAAIFFAFVRIKRPTPQVTFVACFVEGAAFVGLTLSRNPWTLVAVMLVVGMMEAVVNTMAPSVNQKVIPPEMIGRVISFMMVLMSGSEPLARAVSGILIQYTSVPVVLMCSGTIEMVIAIIGCNMPAVRRYAR